MAPDAVPLQPVKTMPTTSKARIDVPQIRDFEGVVAIVSTSCLRHPAGITRLVPLNLVVAAESNDALKGCQRFPGWLLACICREGLLLIRIGCWSCPYRPTAASTA